MFHAYLISTKGWKDTRAKFKNLEDSFFRQPITRTTSWATYEAIDGYSVAVIRFFKDDRD
jgi:hypothetical protein